MVREATTSHKFGDKPYLSFEHVTMTPVSRKLIDKGLLSDRETRWINTYHAEVWEKTRGFFRDDERTRDWLRKETLPL